MLKTENAYGLNAALNKMTCTAISANSIPCSPSQLKLASDSDHCSGSFLSRSMCPRISLHQATSSCDETASPILRMKSVYLKKIVSSDVREFQ